MSIRIKEELALEGKLLIAGAETLSGTTLGNNIISSSLTSVGTLTSGTWQASTIAGKYGGTGIDNDGKTITLGGNLTTVGLFNTVLNVTAATSVTLPISGTLAADTNTLTFTNKTFNLSNNTLSGTLAEFNTALSDQDFATLAGTETLTNKTFNLTNNTLTGTLAEFNTALSDQDFATLAGTETLTNKTVNLTNNTLTGTLAEFNTALSNGSFATLAGTETFTNKTFNLTNNTLTGTLAEFNTALSDQDFATLAGTETLTNKTVNLASNSLTGTLAEFNSALSNGSFATLAGTETLTNKTFNLANNTLSGTLAEFNAALSDGNFATIGSGVAYVETDTTTNDTELPGNLLVPSTFTIDPAAHGDNTGTVVIAGNLQVDGTTTTINSTTLTVDDKNIVLSSGATNKAASDGAGITADLGSDGSATILYDAANDRWEMNKSLATSVIGNVTGQVSDISNHSTTNLAEGTNLYYTDARADARVALSKATDVDFTTNTPTTTSGLVLTSDGDSTYSFQQPVATTQIADLTDVDFTTNTPTTTSGLVLTSDGDSTYSFQSLQTDAVSEGTNNLYYTDARVDARLASGSLGDVTIGGTVTADQYNNDEVRHSIRPSLLLDFANSKRLDPRITFTRPSTATYYDGKTFVLKTAASGAARFDHDPVTGESKGLLIEEQRTNLLTYSEEFSFSTWGTGNGTITRNAGLAPDGMLTADKYVPNNGASNSSIYQPELITSGNYYTWSCYAKQAGHQYIQLRLGDTGFSTATGRASVSVNLANGEVIATTDVGIEYNVENVGDGWYRITLTKDAISSSTGYTWIYPVGSNGSTSAYTGDGNNGFYIWGAQLEVGSFPTSYIRTGNAPATRSADAASMTGTNFSSWYRQDEGTLYADGSVTSTSSSIFLDINDGTALNRLSLYVSSADKAAGIVLINNVTQGSVASTNDFADRKASFAYAVNDYLALSYNGEAVATHTSGNLPVVSQANIGIRADGGNPVTGTIKKIAYYPTSLTNAELQALTET